jgi:hypothetical protein
MHYAACVSTRWQEYLIHLLMTRSRTEASERHFFRWKCHTYPSTSHLIRRYCLTPSVNVSKFRIRFPWRLDQPRVCTRSCSRTVWSTKWIHLLCAKVIDVSPELHKLVVNGSLSRMTIPRITQWERSLSLLSSPIVDRILALCAHFPTRSRWIIGWSYDLGASGLHHAITSDLSVNFSIIDILTHPTTPLIHTAVSKTLVCTQWTTTMSMWRASQCIRHMLKCCRQSWRRTGTKAPVSCLHTYLTKMRMHQHLRFDRRPSSLSTLGTGCFTVGTLWKKLKVKSHSRLTQTPWRIASRNSSQAEPSVATRTFQVRACHGCGEGKNVKEVKKKEEGPTGIQCLDYFAWCTTVGSVVCVGSWHCEEVREVIDKLQKARDFSTSTGTINSMSIDTFF